MEITAMDVVPSIVQVVLAIGIVWLFSGSLASPRFHAGINLGSVIGGLVYAWLSIPLLGAAMVSQSGRTDQALATVALWVLWGTGTAVGMAVGTLNPPSTHSGATLAVVLVWALRTVWDSDAAPAWWSWILTLGFAAVGILTGLVASDLATLLSSVLVGGTFAVAVVASSLSPLMEELGLSLSSSSSSSFLTYLSDVAPGLGRCDHTSPGCTLPRPVPVDRMLILAGLVGVVVVAAATMVRRPKNKSWSDLLFGGTRTATTTTTTTAVSATSTPRRKTPEYAPRPSSSTVVTASYNMFDIGDLPLRLAEYANLVYGASEDLANFFGFQDSSVRNQAEHLLVLLSNHRRYMLATPPPGKNKLPAPIPPSPIHALHFKVFSNYKRWCHYMGCSPHYAMPASSQAGPPAMVGRVVDLVLFFCCWGEAANIRHMPECLWFLYHKMMEEYLLDTSGTASGGSRSLYPGHYLDHVVTPIYQLVFKSMKSNSDHLNKKNYDDFNEFFWSRDCLQYHYCYVDPPPPSTMQSSPGGNTASSVLFGASGNTSSHTNKKKLVSVAEGLRNAPKTFLEKRSWLRSVLALYRILEWHIITFYGLSVFAFKTVLIWGNVRFFQVLSGIFWIMNAMAISANLLEVWSSHHALVNNVRRTEAEVYGSTFQLIFRYSIFVYQTIYWLWTFSGGMSGIDSNTMIGLTSSPVHSIFGTVDKQAHNQAREDPLYWWWQYLWLSSLLLIPYIAYFFANLWPVVSSAILGSRPDGILQSILNLLSPISRMYVGKDVHESFSRSRRYVGFWITLLVFKLYFSYSFEVFAMCVPSLELLDDFYNYPDQSFARLILLMLFRWLPQFLVYIIDLSIWYTVWQAFAGTGVGLRNRLGDVRSMADVRESFVRAPQHFCRKMLSTDAGSRRGSEASSLNLGMQTKRSTTSMNSTTAGTTTDELREYVSQLLDVRIQKWVMFSAAWNEIVDHFREEDILSNTERDYLKFSRFDGFSQAIYLPVFQTAGKFDEAMEEIELHVAEAGFNNTSYSSIGNNDTFPTNSGDAEVFRSVTDRTTTRTAVSEVWELGSYLLVQILGQVHNDDIVTCLNMGMAWSKKGTLTDRLKIEKLKEVVKHFKALVGVLKKGIAKRKSKAAAPRANVTTSTRTTTRAAPKKTGGTGTLGGRMRRAVSGSSLTSMSEEELAPAAATSALEKTAPTTRSSSASSADALRDQARDKLRATIGAIKAMIVTGNSEGQEAGDRLTFLLSMENGFLWHDGYASSQLDRCGADPMFLAVLNKLFGLVSVHPDDTEPRSKEVRRRLTFFVNSLFMDIPRAPTIRDMLSWNVLTPFYSEDVTYTKSDLEKRSDALGVSTMLYLQTLYRNDWNNFLERMGLPDDEKIWSKKYINETRTWASLRAQTLSRTVHGMMYNEKALRFLAQLERLDAETTDQLMCEKFGYIVTAQIYGTMKKNQDGKAEDIDNLMHKFPHMRVAYIDTVRLNRAGATEFYSVLIKSHTDITTGVKSIQEVFRVRLPGNPVIGEGKPENQNHAMIFTRGEYLQTIDMNQEGYFEESLKMRNALEEFRIRDGPMPNTILGLREHVFTGSVSSLAKYMALQETAFVTLGQRVLTDPLCIRLHYGHPDVFDKLFFLTRGGISKSSKGINLSEDIFAGFNNLIRGGQVAFREYVQVGKGRDVGMSQIYKFEAKLAQGNTEQSLSRDVYRIGHRLDFFRLFSFYYGGIGHYISTVLTILTIYLVVYLMMFLAIFDLESIGGRIITPMGTIQMILGGLGLLQTIPLFATLGVERGWLASLSEIFQVMFTGGVLHFMFHIQTKAHYMNQTILVGGAKYRATGRGFVTSHTPMDEQFRFFASSHLYLGVEMAAALVLMIVFTKAGQCVGRTWSLWLAASAFMISPFVFNPLTFQLDTAVSDYTAFLQWMSGTSGGPTKSWSIWWREENAFYKNLDVTSKLCYAMKSIVFCITAEGLRRSDLFYMAISEADHFQIRLPVWLTILAIFVILALYYWSMYNRLSYSTRRTMSITIVIGLVVGAAGVLVEDINCYRYFLFTYYYVAAACQLGLLFGVEQVQFFYKIHDYVCGHILFIFIFLATFVQFHKLQSWCLYHNALTDSVVVDNVLRFARRSQERDSGENVDEGDLMEQLAELQKKVQRQEQMLGSGNYSEVATPKSSGVSEQTALLPQASAMKQPTYRSGDQSSAAAGPSLSSGKRIKSMSGMDVWGDMALGGPESGGSSSGYRSTSAMQTPLQPTAQGGFSFTQPDTMPPR